MHVAPLLHTTLMNNEVQRSKSFHTAVVQYYSVVGHSPSLFIIILLLILTTWIQYIISQLLLQHTRHGTKF